MASSKSACARPWAAPLAALPDSLLMISFRRRCADDNLFSRFNRFTAI